MTVSEKLRLVQGLHSHAEMFGFNWNDGSDWTWHDVACKIADDIDAENAKLRELVKLMHGTIKDLQIAFDASVVVGGVELSAEYFETEYMRELGIEVS